MDKKYRNYLPFLEIVVADLPHIWIWQSFIRGVAYLLDTNTKILYISGPSHGIEGVDKDYHHKSFLSCGKQLVPQS